MSNSFHRPLQVPQTQEEDKFEDVGLDDPKPQPPKKRGIFARMVDGVPGVGDSANRPTSSDNNKGGAWHNFTSRKRGQSGHGAELGSMPMPKREDTPKPEKQQRQQQQQPQAQEEVRIDPQPQQPQQSPAPKQESTQAPEIKVDS